MHSSACGICVVIRMLRLYARFSLKESVKHVKMIVPSVIMFGVAPHYILIWVAWRLISCVLPKSVYQAGDDLYYTFYQRLVLFFCENWTGTKLYLFGDAVDVIKKKENVVYISNHQSTVDWMVIHMLADRQGSLGHCRYVIKDEVKYVPLYGFYFYQHGCVFIKRNLFNSKKLLASLDYLKDEKIPSWIIIFPEGTRYNPKSVDVIEKSEKFAVERGLAPLKHLLTPRPKGMHLILQHMKDNLDAVYDATVIYSCTKNGTKSLRTSAPSMFEFVTGVCDAVYIHVNRIEIPTIPSDESEFKFWLHNLYAEKDKLLDNFYSGQQLPQCTFPYLGGVVSPPNHLRNLSVFATFCAMTLPIVVTPFGRSLYWKSLLYVSVSGYIWFTIRSVS